MISNNQNDWTGPRKREREKQEREKICTMARKHVVDISLIFRRLLLHGAEGMVGGIEREREAGGEGCRIREEY